MDGLMHPVGPESPTTYWLRRGVVLAVLLVVLVGAGFLISSLAGAQNRTPAEPAAAPEATAPITAPPAPVETAATQPEPAPASPTPTPAPSTAATTNPPAPKPAPQPTRAPEPAKPTPTPSPTMGEWKAPAGQAACDPKRLGVAIDGPRQVTAGKPEQYALKVTNESDVACTFELSPTNFELKVYSGTDRIWSSLDCTVDMPPRRIGLAPRQSADWSMEWRVNRSVGACKAHPESLRSGTYVATAQVKDARPVQLVMQLRG